MSIHSYTIRNTLNPDSFVRASEACQRFIERQTKADIGGWDGTGSATFSDSLICFNGKGKDGHQTFQIRLDGGGPHACDTQHASYDIVVRGCLLILKEHLGDDLEISIGDNHLSATELARALVESYTGMLV